MKRSKNYFNNYEFIDSIEMNATAYDFYLCQLGRLALSMFEWINLPKSMNARFLEKTLFESGKACFLKDKKYGFINTRCSSAESLNIYDLPTKLNCFSHEYQTSRKLYTGLGSKSENMREYLETSEAILIGNDWDFTPTYLFMDFFAKQLAECNLSAFVNIKAQKTPVMILVDNNQLLAMKNLFSQYNGNAPIIFGDKNQLGENVIRAVKTEAPFVADKIVEYRKEIFNEILTFLGINNIITEKKERLISDEANSNNELINLNLQSFLAPRQEACRQFNEKFNFTGTEKEISVRVRSDLHNIIKNTESIIVNYKEPNKKEVVLDE